MIKRILKSAVLASALMATSLMAEVSEYEYNTYSLVGLEGGYSSFDYTNTTSETLSLNHGGFKIGGQSENYRLFLSIRAYDSADFDYARTYGVEGQYLFNFSKYVNFFLGINGGVADMKFIDSASGDSVKVYDPYYGGDAGFNIHIGDMADLELGARIMTINSDVTVGVNTYEIDNIVTGYASIIFKYKMD